MTGPVDSQNDLSDTQSRIPRRGALRLALGGVCACYAAVVGYPVYQYLEAPPAETDSTGGVRQVSLPEADLPAAGSVTLFTFGKRPALLIRHKDGSLVCFDAVCTHKGCTVHFDPIGNQIMCPCHGARFDAATGAATAGPTDKPLALHAVAIADGVVTITRA